ncbi:MAG: hypothetical protein IH847_00430 [Acidobacteria bacterium]|nr:hypothetical protein [Acidobacteriota bacterium]
MTIIISKGGKNATKVEMSAIEKEDYLQRYVYENPESIPLYEIKEDIRLLILVREFPTASGPIDALGVDGDGEIYLVETKLYKNPDKRLVVAQVLDYGASLWRYRDFNEFVGVVEGELNKKFGVGLHQRLKDFFGLEEDEVAGLLDNLRRNLNEGNFKFVVLMDKLHERLKDLIVFVNQNSKFDLFAVELEFYRFEEYEIVIPKLFGAEVKKDVGARSGGGSRSEWDEDKFFRDATQKLGEKELVAVKRLYEFSKGIAETISWGSGAKTGSFNVKFDRISRRSLYSVYSSGLLSVHFGWLDDSETARSHRDEFKKRIEGIKGFIVPESYQEIHPAFPPERWCPVVDDFIVAVRELLKEGK